MDRPWLPARTTSPPRPPGPRASTPPAVSAPDARSTAVAGSCSDPGGRPGPRRSFRGWGGDKPSDQPRGLRRGQTLPLTPQGPSVGRAGRCYPHSQRQGPTPAPRTRGFPARHPPSPASPRSPPPRLSAGLAPPGSPCTRPGGHARPWNGGAPQLPGEEGDVSAEVALRSACAALGRGERGRSARSVSAHGHGRDAHVSGTAAEEDRRYKLLSKARGPHMKVHPGL